MLEVKKQKA